MLHARATAEGLKTPAPYRNAVLGARQIPNPVKKEETKEGTAP
jgi:multicomponent K+:H+ antiporter subunit D